MTIMKDRLSKFEEQLAHSEADAILITNLNNIYYLTGFSGTAATVFISGSRRIFLTDSRYTLIAKSVVKNFDIVETRDALTEISKIVKNDKLTVVGFEEEVSYNYFKSIETSFPNLQLLPLTNFVENLRMIKDVSEIEAIRRACHISDRAFLDLLDFIKPNKTSEREVMNFLDGRMRQLGATGASFDFIVASGYRSAMPHGVASDKIIQMGDMLTMDFGCYYNHYVSDITRTVHIGPASDEENEIYGLVLRSNQAVIDSVKPGMTRRDYDKVARDVIDEAGYGQFFTHGIGHGVGLDVHEVPYFSNYDGSVEVGMVITDEPGIYIDNSFGVRIEDDLVITENGCEVLTLAPKELIVL